MTYNTKKRNGTTKLWPIKKFCCENVLVFPSPNCYTCTHQNSLLSSQNNQCEKESIQSTATYGKQ
jgi:hypothetical protein